MEMNTTVSVEIRAREEWNRTGIQLVRGEKYMMTASGKWVDFFIPHDADGDPSPNAYLRSFESSRRVPNEDWFTLMGAYDTRAETAFRIGSGLNYTASETGELTCFANDVESFYWNNWGHITLSVTRTA